ncbi:protein MpGARP6 [Marchantia polymorpha subsp. ruderalis]|uniref:HTH myb-type domain-containing protein n=2 Tax=Marchantia polymorpha TaxID=3197 RepID=A0AAF6BA41_MARPO|nr:hypothetical protein MARPO_0119s0041 [Marchantia polymorpha]BBN08875.1 hypothetical protein Mp_4g15170 [Marchantia polymorpha subsp. ruderalis]|eukprot:PTQ30841.1 hypothetical protein MARPO_0119s0041 [Marchantia polymorpha]
MGSPADLTLGCRPQSSGNEFKAVSTSGDQIERVRKLDEYLKALEDERHKIEAFKRELPHCMQLLDYAIEVSKDRLVDSPRSSSGGGHAVDSYGEVETSTLGSFGKHVVEEFLKKSWEAPKREIEEVEKVSKRSDEGRDADHRPSWMAEAQLWSQPSTRSDAWKEKESSTEDSTRRQRDTTEQSTVTSPANLFNTHKRTGGAFLPFIKEKPVATVASRVKVLSGADLALSSVESRPASRIALGPVESEAGSLDVSTTRTRDVGMEVVQAKDNGRKLNGSGSGGNHSGGTGSTSSGGGGGGSGQAQRKARRCWSPELHRRFVSALQQLGGSQIATPKQIRELMKVDGLTNDEVKSHLQKYRLHTRRPSPAPQAPQQQAPQLVVLGGIWVPPEYTSGGMYHDPSSSVSQQGHFCQASLSQEIYSQLNPSAQIQLHRSQSHSSPQGPLQSTSQLSSGARQTSAEMYREDSPGEDGKSESSSWKGEDDSRGRSEKESDREVGSGGRDDDEDDTDVEDEGRESGMRLKLEMAFTRSHTVMKPEPQMA